MFKIFEVYFDLIYLLLMFGFGINLITRKEKSSKLLATMAILLALGDSFHLLPRVYSHLCKGGLLANAVYLSYGKLITGITMSVFYIIFYKYYTFLGGKSNNIRFFSLCFLFLVRIILILLPQNNWKNESPYYMEILRNIPFLIMGVLLIVWTYKEKAIKGMKNASYLIALSFFFYIVVVVFSPFVNALGALMMPKTVCYILLVYNFYKIEVKNFNRLILFNTSITFLILSLGLGVFYREFTKPFNLTLTNKLALTHLHMLVLGFVFSFMLYILFTIEKIDINIIKKSYIFYIFGLLYFTSSLMLRGIYQISSNGQILYSETLLEVFIGLSHVILAVSLVNIIIKIYDYFHFDKFN